HGMPFELEHEPQALGRIRIVVDDEDATRHDVAGARRACSRRMRSRHRRGLAKRQAHGELAAAAWPIAASADGSSVSLDELPRERKPDPEPAPAGALVMLGHLREHL